MRLRAVKWILIYFLCGFILVASLDAVWVELRAPRFVVHGHSAVLRCEHNVDPETLYKVVFFKNGQRIMQYVQGRDPPFELYNFTGADINLIKMTPTSITLEKMDFPASGSYACEIALEIPLYSKGSKLHEISVIVRQKYRPKIKIKHKKLSPNDDLEATCQSAPAYPAPHLTWLINNVKLIVLYLLSWLLLGGIILYRLARVQYRRLILSHGYDVIAWHCRVEIKVDERLTIPHGTVSGHRHHHGMPLSLTNSSLRFPLTSLQLYPNQTVDITCLSTIPSYANIGEGYADIQNHTVAVNVVRMEPPPTQLPVKIMSVQYNTSCLTCINQIIYYFLYLMLLFTMY